jgi:hypothetical protein
MLILGENNLGYTIFTATDGNLNSGVLQKTNLFVLLHKLVFVVDASPKHDDLAVASQCLVSACYCLPSNGSDVLPV